VRFVAATPRDRARAAAPGRFRLDLYHRLAVGVIELPALRDRVADVPLLVRHFLDAAGVAGLTLDPGALALLQRHPWPGNVRELRNAMQRAMLLADGGGPLRAEDFRFLADTRGKTPVDGYVRCLGRPFSDIRREIYLANLHACGGNRSAAAGALGIPKSTFFDHLRDMGM
jgi:two-component system NtrC family response regulator